MDCISDLLSISCENENEIIAEQNLADICNVIRLSLPVVVSFVSVLDPHETANRITDSTISTESSAVITFLHIIYLSFRDN